MSIHTIEPVQSGLRSYVITSANEFLKLRDAWNSLCLDCHEATIFSTWEWTSSVWNHTSDRCCLFVAVVEDEAGLIGIAPLLIDRSKWPVRTLRFIAAGTLGWSLADYGGFIVASGKEEQGIAALLAELLRRATEWDVLDLQEVPEHSCLMATGLEQIKRCELSLIVDRQSCSHPVPLAENRPDWLASRSGRSRSTLERKLRRLALQHELRVERIERADDLARGMGALFDLHGQRWQSHGQPGTFGRPQAQRLHLELAEKLLERGMLSLLILTADGLPVSAVYDFRFRGTEYCYALGLRNGEEWARHSVGTSLLHHSIRDASEAGMTTFDLMRGDESYKLSIGACSTQNYGLQIARSSAALRGYLWAKRIHNHTALLLPR